MNTLKCCYPLRYNPDKETIDLCHKETYTAICDEHYANINTRIEELKGMYDAGVEMIVELQNKIKELNKLSDEAYLILKPIKSEPLSINQIKNWLIEYQKRQI